jgi:hypothetical protein
MMPPYTLITQMTNQNRFQSPVLDDEKGVACAVAVGSIILNLILTR